MRIPSELHQPSTLRATVSKTVSALGFVLLFLLGALPASAQWSNGYTYRRTITIDHTKVPNTDQSNFPVLISGTYSYLATTSNGGNVTNANGYDIIFTSDSGGTSALAFEQESYSASTGAVKYWVKVATVSHTTDTVIYLFYDNSSVTTDQSNKTGVWDSNYKGVWHLEDNAANTTVKDSTSNSDNGTSVANTSSKTATGEIDKGLSFNGSSDGITTSISSSKTFTWEAWVNTISSSNYYSIIDFGDSNFMLMQLYGGAGSFWTSDVPLYGVNLGITGLSNGTWYHVVFSRSGDSGTYSAYLNGSLTGTHSSGTWSGTTTIAMGERPAYGGQYFDGTLDELRVSNSLRSADWISTEYKNESSPSTFYTVGSATTCVSITSLSPVWGEIDSPVTITGTNFGSTQGSSTVTFNGTIATVSSGNWSATSITTTVPDGATTGNVVVTVSSAASNGINFAVSSGGGSDSSGVYYYFSDQLGTARVITDANGNVCYDGDLYPYGGERAVTDVCDSNYKFTGKERDDESGLDNFGARYDSWQYGRFMTPDWSAKPQGVPYATLGNPQSLNLYSYVMNNPLTGRDLDGHSCMFGLAAASCHQAGSSSSEMAAEQQQNTSSAQNKNTQQSPNNNSKLAKIVTRVVAGVSGAVNVAFGSTKAVAGAAATVSAETGVGAAVATYGMVNGAGQAKAGYDEVKYAVTGNEKDEQEAESAIAHTTISGQLVLAAGGTTSNAAFVGGIENDVPTVIGSSATLVERATTFVNWATGLMNSANPGSQ